MTHPDQITVRVLKYDGLESRRWQASLSRREEDLIVLDAQFDEDIQHDLLGEISSGTRTIEYYWLNRWYNVFRFLEPNGETRLFYCNVSMPPVMSGGALTYIDLDTDVLVQPNLSYQVLDLEEFEENAGRYQYPDHVKALARAAIEDLISLIEGRQFPFS